MLIKKCPKCIEEISIDASICPNCQSPQNNFDRFVKSNLLSTILITLFIIFLYVEMMSDNNTYDKYDVEIVVLSHSIIETKHGKGLAIFANVRNTSDMKLYDFYFDVEVFSKSGVLKEVFSDSVYGLSLLPDETKKIELSRTMVSSEEREYNFKIQLSRAGTKL